MDKLSVAREVYWQYLERIAAERGMVLDPTKPAAIKRGDCDREHGVQIALAALAQPAPIDVGAPCPKCAKGRLRPKLRCNECVTVFPTLSPDAVAEERERIASFVERYPSPLNDLPMALAIRDLAAAIRGGAE